MKSGIWFTPEREAFQRRNAPLGHVSNSWTHTQLRDAPLIHTHKCTHHFEWHSATLFSWQSHQPDETEFGTSGSGGCPYSTHPLKKAWKAPLLGFTEMLLFLAINDIIKLILTHTNTHSVLLRESVSLCEHERTQMSLSHSETVLCCLSLVVLPVRATTPLCASLSSRSMAVPRCSSTIGIFVCVVSWHHVYPTTRALLSCDQLQTAI